MNHSSRAFKGIELSASSENAGCGLPSPGRRSPSTFGFFLNPAGPRHISTDLSLTQSRIRPPANTFFLVGDEGEIAWLRDYGAPEHGGAMYVATDEITSQLEEHLTEP